jgi:predicted phosphodiesterase
MLKILHISDIHLKKNKLEYYQNKIISEFLKDVKDIIDTNTILIISGDFLLEGGRLFNEENDPFDSVNTFLENIITNFPLLKKRIFFVPGNHDIQRSSLDKYIDYPFKSNLIKSKNEIDGFISEVYDNKRALRGFEKYNDFASIFYSDYDNKQLSNLDNSFIIEIDDLKIGVSCLNSSWLCYDDDDYNNIVMGVKQIENSLEFIRDCDLKICIQHHPLKYLSENLEQDRIKRIIQSEYDLFFIGHIHNLSTDYIQGDKGNYFVSVGKSLTGNEIDSRAYSDGYSFLEYTSKKIKCTLKEFDGDKFNLINSGLIENGVLEFITKKKNYKTNNLEFKKKFREYIDDTGANFTSKSSFDIKLDNIYVNPLFESYNLNDDEPTYRNVYYESIIDKISKGKFKNTYIFGEENSGKTTLTKRISLYLFNNHDIIPVIIEGRDLKKTGYKDFKKVLLKKLNNSYNNFTEDNLDKVYVIIDDLKSSKLDLNLKKRLLENIQDKHSTLIIWDEFLTLSELIETDHSNNHLFELIPFTTKKRFELIQKWIDFTNQEEEIDSTKKLELYYNMESIINSILGKNLVPSFPIYILVILQSNEISSTNTFEQSTFGYYYDVLIKSSIGKVVKGNKEIDKILSYLSEFAFFLFDNKTLKVSEVDLNKFHIGFNEDFGLDTSFVTLLLELLETQILVNDEGFYKFKYRYLFFYFIGRYLSDNIENPTIKNEISKLSNKLHQTYSANIYLFLSHHSKSSFIIDQLILKSQNVFSNSKRIYFNEDVKEINKMVNELTDSLSIDNSKSNLENKNSDLDDNDRRSIHNQEVDEYDDISKETNTSLDDRSITEIDILSEINTSFKSIEILGNIIKNRYASLKADKKEEIIKNIYLLSNRTLSYIFNIILEGDNSFKEEILSLLKNDENLTALERDNIAKSMIFNLIYMNSYSIIKKVSNSISSKDLKLTFKKVLEDNPNDNYIELLTIANSYDFSFEFPFKKTNDLITTFKKNKLPFYILRRLAYNYLRLKPISESNQQKITSILDITIDNQRKVNKIARER